MTRFRYIRIARALLLLAASWITTVTLVFFLPALPGADFTEEILKRVEHTLEPQHIEKLRRDWKAVYYLDQPLLMRWWRFFSGTLQGNLGTSASQYPARVADLVWPATLYTWKIFLFSMITGWLGGILITGAARRSPTLLSYLNHLFRFLAIIPFFAWCLILIHFSAFMSSEFLAWMAPTLALWIRHTRNLSHRLTGIDHYPHIRFMRLIGIPEWQIRRDFFRRQIFPQMRDLFTQSGKYFPGILLCDLLCAQPGCGSLLAQSIATRDIPLMQGTILTLSLSWLLAHILLTSIFPLEHHDLDRSTNRL